MDHSLLSLKWNNHNGSFNLRLSSLRSMDLFTDVTLACDGKFYSSHKFVLSTCSEYFESMFKEAENKHPIIVLKDVKCDDLEYLLDYMYLGEVNVPQSQLSSLIAVAECLKIRGLAVPDEKSASLTGAHKRSSKSFAVSPRAKRKRASSPHAERHNDGCSQEDTQHGPSNNTSECNSKEAYSPSIDNFEERKAISNELQLSVDSRLPKKLSADVSDQQTFGVAVKEEPNEIFSEFINDDSAVTTDMKHLPPSDVGESLSDLHQPGDDSSASATENGCLADQQMMTSVESAGIVDELLGGTEESAIGESLFTSSDASYLHRAHYSSNAIAANITRDIPISQRLPFEQMLVEVPTATDQQSLHFSSAGNSDITTDGCNVLTMTAANDKLKRCPLCPYTSNKTSNLKDHLRTHSGEKPFSCPHCSSWFTRGTSLRRHLLFVHSIGQNKKCGQHN